VLDNGRMSAVEESIPFAPLPLRDDCQPDAKFRRDPPGGCEPNRFESSKFKVRDHALVNAARCRNIDLA